ncbi:MAG TPA: hypothetical protein VK983_02580 [Candidatus Limnocylindrales bacterium]|nr:hypothetical protein [Candidatus Limnocylindrales bacterium]
MAEQFHYLPIEHKPLEASQSEVDIVRFSALSIIRDVSKGEPTGDLDVTADPCPSGQIGYTFSEQATARSQQIHLGYEAGASVVHLGRRYEVEGEESKNIEIQSCCLSDDGAVAAAVRGEFPLEYMGFGLQRSEPTTPYPPSAWQMGLDRISSEIGRPKPGFFRRFFDF